MEGLPLGERKGMSLERLESAYRNGSRDDVLRTVSELDPSETGDHGITAVHICAKQVDPEAMEVLLSRGFRAGATDEYGRTPLHILAVQRWDGEAEEMARCTELLLSNRCPPNRRDDTGQCFYHIAAKMHNHPMIMVIGERKVRCDSLIDSSGMNALHIMCDMMSSLDYDRREHPDHFAERDRLCRDMAEALISCGIDPDAETAIGRKAIDFAVEHGCKITGAFLRGGPPEAGGMDIFQAAMMNDAVAVQALADSGCDLEALCDGIRDYTGMTPLMIACRRLSGDAAKALLENGASATTTNGSDGRTAMYHLLVSLGSTVGTGTNDRGSQSLLGILDPLLAAQGSPNIPIGDAEGPALCFICANDRLGYTSDSKDARAVAFDRLISSGADVNVTDGSGRTPLMCACTVSGHESENFVSTLMEMGADPDVQDSHGRTAVMYAAEIGGNGGLDLIRMVFDFCSPDLALRDSDEKTAADIAAENGNNEVLKLLLG